MDTSQAVIDAAAAVEGVAQELEGIGRSGSAKMLRNAFDTLLGVDEGAALPPADDATRRTVAKAWDRYRDGMSGAARDVLLERRRQIDVKNWTAEHDGTHSPGELACAAACYATEAELWTGHEQADHKGRPTLIGACRVWPWPGQPKLTDRRRNLVKAGALILAEIERLDRATASTPTPEA